MRTPRRPGPSVLRYVLCEAFKFLSLLCPLRSVFRAPLHAIGNTDRIQRSSDHVVANTRKIFHAATADQHDRVLLQVVPDTGNIGRDFNAIGQPHTRHLAQCRIWLLRGLRVHAGADAALLRTSLQCRARRLVSRPLPAFSHQLIKRRHSGRSLAAHSPAHCAHDEQIPFAATRIVAWPAQGRPLLLAAQFRYCKLTPERFWIPLRLTLPTVAPGQTPGALRFVSLALHILSHKGERRRRYISARKVFEPFSSETYFTTAQLPAYLAAQHIASLDELAEPNYYNNCCTHRQPGFLHPTLRTGSFPQNSGWSCLILVPASKLQVFQFISTGTLHW